MSWCPKCGGWIYSESIRPHQCPPKFQVVEILWPVVAGTGGEKRTEIIDWDGAQTIQAHDPEDAAKAFATDYAMDGDEGEVKVAVKAADGKVTRLLVKWEPEVVYTAEPLEATP